MRLSFFRETEARASPFGPQCIFAPRNKFWNCSGVPIHRQVGSEVRVTQNKALPSASESAVSTNSGAVRPNKPERMRKVILQIASVDNQRAALLPNGGSLD